MMQLVKLVSTVILSISVTSIQFGNIAVAGQDQAFKGPILVTQSIGAIGSITDITFQDLGTNRVWQYETSASLDDISPWVTDGCSILLSNGDHLSRLDITTLDTEDFPPNVRPVWSFDAQTTVFIAAFPKSSYVNIYMSNSGWGNRDLIDKVGKGLWVNDYEWLNNYEFAYFIPGWRMFVLDRITKKVNFLEENPRSIPDYGAFYAYRLAPNRNVAALFADLNEYRSEGNSFVNTLTDDDFATLEANKPTKTGFDLFSLLDGTIEHIDVNGQFLFFLEWSPSGHKIALVTDFKGQDYAVYVYDVEHHILSRIADATVYLEIPTMPTWSRDEKWLAFRTEEGYAIERLADGKRVRLDKRMDGAKVYWSPVMDYSQSHCGV